MRASFFTIIVCLLTFAVSPSLATGVPAALWGKTISVSYTRSTPVVEDKGRYAGRAISQTIYISSVGRIFERKNQRSPVGRAAQDYDPGQSSWGFAGGKLVSHISWSGGADLLEIGFDSNFQSCTLSGVFGHENGKVRTWKGLDGNMYTAAGPPVLVGERCSISAGNGL